jgi:hypothetical protein
VTSKSPLGKATAIYSYVKLNFNWDGFASKYTGKPLKEFIRSKTGNAAEINLFLCAMMNEAGVKAYPVILSTRSHGKIPIDFPFPQFLNYVIVLIDLEGKRYLLDATEPLACFGMLPARCLNEKGLIVIKDKTEWVDLVDEASSIEIDSVKITFNSNLDTVNLSAKVISDGHLALNLRGSYLSDAEEFQKELVSGEMRIKVPVKVSNQTESEKPFIYDYSIIMPVQTVSDKILIDPFPGLVPDENPLKMSSRNYPVDMIYPIANVFNSVIEIPKDYTFAEVIKDVNIDNALVKITYTTRNSADKLTIDGSYAFKKAVYLPHEYFELKRSFTTIVETFNNKIILQKIL